VIRRIGYTSSDMGFDADSCGVTVSVGEQSQEIGDGVTTSAEHRAGDDGDALDQQGAGDQGIMFGYATNETPTYMPMAIWTAHRIAERLTEVRRSGQLAFLRPDGKTQVTLGYDGATPKTVETVVLSTQHSPDISQADLAEAVERVVIRPVLEETGLDISNVTLHINPSGSFELGGPKADAGLTGRKIIIDTYGGAARHGGGAFSGKDPSKVDRSAAYAMRWVAKNAVAAGLAERLEVQVAYAIGKAQPVGLYVETFGTARIDEAKIVSAIGEVFDLRPAAIIRDLDLLRPIYAKTAAYGHFGRELPEFTWEKLDRVDALRAAAGL
jgi:S-adenosylmethionine synthetase